MEYFEPDDWDDVRSVYFDAPFAGEKKTDKKMRLFLLICKGEQSQAACNISLTGCALNFVQSKSVAIS